MERQIERYNLHTRIIRWVARFSSILSIGLILGFIIGEGIHYSSMNEWLGFLFFPFGISVGMILAWQKEGLGGSITILSLIIFYIIYFLSTDTFPKGLAWLLFSIPGFLFLLCWFRSKKRKVKPA